MFAFHNPQLVISAARSEQWPESELNEVLMVGKSNVGKSSLINALVNRKSLAYVGQTPGKTRLLNFYNLDEKLMLVDAPGYGYAKAPRSEIQKWGAMIDDYLHNTELLKHALLLIDIRHEPTADDETMVKWLLGYSMPFSIILTKCDKLSKSKLAMQAAMIKKQLKLPAAVDCIYFSVPGKMGRDELLKKMESVLNGTFGQQ